MEAPGNRYRREAELSRILELMAGALAGVATHLVPWPLPRLPVVSRPTLPSGAAGTPGPKFRIS